MSNLNSFSLNIPNLNNRTASDLIPIFAYYLQEVKGVNPFTAADIASCFNKLAIKPYSNISSFLQKQRERQLYSLNSKKDIL